MLIYFGHTEKGIWKTITAERERERGKKEREMERERGRREERRAGGREGVSA